MSDNILKPNIIFASFPRSGNTFLRNVLYEVYGIYSWNNIERFNASAERYLTLLDKKQKKGFLNPKQFEKLNILDQQFRYKAMKSHELPVKTLPLCEENPVIIYLVRDGRDALVSAAHHRKDIVEPGTDFTSNLKQAIKAQLGSYFGGWGYNVIEWMSIANIVFRFEDFIKDPISHTEKLRSFIEMPEPNINNLPTFESQKHGGAHFGGNARNKFTEKEKSEFNQKFFRKGKVGGWRDDMTDELHELFWNKYGETMERLGYHYDGSIVEENLERIK